VRDSSLSYRAAPDPGGVSVPIRTTSGVPHILGSSGVGCPKACDRRAPWPLEPHGRSLRVSPQRSEHRSQWPKAVIELENPRQAFTVPALRRVIGDVLLTGHSQIVIGLPAQTLIDNDALVALCITARHAIAPWGGIEGGRRRPARSRDARAMSARRPRVLLLDQARTGAPSRRRHPPSQIQMA
jgi:hypothetical protein